MARRVGEISLWRAVILQSVLDAINQSNNREVVKSRKKAIEWLSIKNREFIAVCELACLEPTFVMRKIKVGVRFQRPWRRSCDIGKGLQFADSIGRV